MAANTQTETAVLAGGCFWGVEHIFRKLPGVIETTVGYTGGTTSAPTYREVCSGKTGHAEAIEVVFDRKVQSFESILRVFFRMHDPTTLNRQHNDVGTQYRSAIFVESKEQKDVAERLIKELTEGKKFQKPIVTQIVDASVFYAAEEEHQKYLMKNPGGYNCHILQPE